jgi:lambda family phage portal protein
MNLLTAVLGLMGLTTRRSATATARRGRAAAAQYAAHARFLQDCLRKTAGWDVTNSTRFTSALHRKISYGTPSAEWASFGRRLQGIGRYLTDNIPEASRVVDYYVSRILGRYGLRPHWGTGERKWDEYLRDAFLEWGKTCDKRGELGWADIQELWVREIATVGEAFTHMAVLDGELVLDPFEADQLDMAFGAADSTETIANGIAYDRYGRKTKYYRRRSDPGSAAGWVYDELAASSVAHGYCRRRPQQYRGVSEFDSTGQKFHDLESIDFSERQAIKAASYYGLWLKESEDAASLRDPVDASESETADQSQKQREDELFLEPGMINSGPETPTLMDVNRPSNEYIQARIAWIQAICARFNTPYSAVSGDTSKANYSSSRVAMLECQPGIQRDQDRLGRMLAGPMVDAWARFAALKGVIRLPASLDLEEVLLKKRFQTPGFPWMDPKAEAAWYRDRLDMGLESWPASVSQMGRDPMEVLEEIEETQKLAASRGVALPVPGFATKGPQPAASSPPREETEEDEEENGTDIEEPNEESNEEEAAAHERVV